MCISTLVLMTGCGWGEDRRLSTWWAGEVGFLTILEKRILFPDCLDMGWGDIQSSTRTEASSQGNPGDKIQSTPTPFVRNTPI